MRDGPRQPSDHASVYVGLHAGEVFYGNIGSEDRLDFTVVGPAVNEVSRIAACADRWIAAWSCPPSFGRRPIRNCAKLVSVGRFALRGVGRAQDLFTPDPGINNNSTERMLAYRNRLGLPLQ